MTLGPLDSAAQALLPVEAGGRPAVARWSGEHGPTRLAGPGALGHACLRASRVRARQSQELSFTVRRLSVELHFALRRLSGVGFFLLHL